MESTLKELSNGTKNTQIGLRMTKLWPYEVGEKNRGLQPRRDVRNDVATWQRASETTSRREKRRRDVAESCRNDVATSLHDVATFGVYFGWIFSRFLSKNPRGGDWMKGERILGVFEGEQAPFGWKHPRACS